MLKIRKKEPLEAVQVKELIEMGEEKAKEWMNGRLVVFNKVAYSVTFRSAKGKWIDAFNNDWILRSQSKRLYFALTDKEVQEKYEVVEDA